MKTIKELRQDLFLTQLEIALDSGIGYSTFCKIEQQGCASHLLVKQLAKYFDLSTTQITNALRATVMQRKQSGK